MRYQVIVLEDAKNDLKQAINYITNRLENPIAADRLEKDIRNKILGLAFMPQRNRIKSNIYSIKVRNYRILYEVYGKYVLVFGIYHKLQNIREHIENNILQ